MLIARPSFQSLFFKRYPRKTPLMQSFPSLLRSNRRVYVFLICKEKRDIARLRLGPVRVRVRVLGKKPGERRSGEMVNPRELIGCWKCSVRMLGDRLTLQALQRNPELGRGEKTVEMRWM